MGVHLLKGEKSAEHLSAGYFRKTHTCNFFFFFFSDLQVTKDHAQSEILLDNSLSCVILILGESLLLL